MLRIFCLSLILPCLLLAGCAGGGSVTALPNPPLPRTSTRGQFGGLEFTLTFPKNRYARNERLGPITFTVQNVTSAPIFAGLFDNFNTLTFYRNGQNVDRYTSISGGGAGYTLNPGEVLTGRWDGTAYYEPGEYTVVASLTATNVGGTSITPGLYPLLNTEPLVITVE